MERFPNSFNPHVPDTLVLLKSILAQVMDKHRRASWIHIGADEVSTGASSQRQGPLQPSWLSGGPGRHGAARAAGSPLPASRTSLASRLGCSLLLVPKLVSAQHRAHLAAVAWHGVVKDGLSSALGQEAEQQIRWGAESRESD